MNIFSGSPCWNSRQLHGQTRHPTENFVAMNLFKILCAVTWAWLFLTSEVMEAVRGHKHHSEAKNGMKELIYWKKYLIKVSQQPQKPLSGSNQIWATTSDKKDTSQRPQLSPNPRARVKRLRSPRSGIRAGWNKRAEGANFETLINEQGEKIRNMKEKNVKQ